MRRRVAALEPGAALSPTVHRHAARPADRRRALMVGALEAQDWWRHHRRDTDDLWAARARVALPVVAQAASRICGHVRTDSHASEGSSSP